MYIDIDLRIAIHFRIRKMTDTISPALLKFLVEDRERNRKLI